MAHETLDPDEFYAAQARRERRRQQRRTRKARTPRTAPAWVGQLTGRLLSDELRHLQAFPAGRLLVRTVAAIAALTILGLIALWPSAFHHQGPSQSFGGPSQSVKVTRSTDLPCPAPIQQTCRRLQVSVHGRPEAITLGPVSTAPSISTGERVRISRITLRTGVAAAAGAGAERYQFIDVDRQGSLWQLAIGLGLLAFAVLRWRGLLAMIGVGLSLLLLVLFVIPAILTGEPALLVAMVGALSVMFITLVLTNGVGAQTLAAALGITLTLLLTATLATVLIAVVHLDGRGNEAALYLSQQNQTLSLQGVVLAGMIIGALGVLADTAVTQASAVMALRRANPALTAPGLYREAFSIGRDHLSATIHTLVLAYAGASLPTLLAMRASGLPFGDAVNSQALAEPILATAIGCAALIAAVPLTTGLASLLVARLPATALADSHGHGHSH